MNAMNAFLRPARQSDIELLYRWANDPAVRQNSFSTEPILYEDHIKWFEKILHDNSEALYILIRENEPIGQIRLTFRGESAIIGYCIAPEKRGRGYGRLLLELAEAKVKSDYPEIKKLVAMVKPQNQASAVCFLHRGFQEELRQYVLELESPKKVDITHGGGNIS